MIPQKEVLLAIIKADGDCTLIPFNCTICAVYDTDVHNCSLNNSELHANWHENGQNRINAAIAAYDIIYPGELFGDLL